MELLDPVTSSSYGERMFKHTHTQQGVTVEEDINFILTEALNCPATSARIQMVIMILIIMQTYL